MSPLANLFAVPIVYGFISQVIITSVHAEEPKEPPKGGTVSTSKQIIIRSRLIEVNRTKVRKLGIDFSVLDDDGKIVRLTSDDQSLVAFNLAVPYGNWARLDALCQNNAARILSEPTITTLDGKPASLAIGSTIEILRPPGTESRTETTFVGTKLDVDPQIVKDDRVRLEYRLSWKEPVERNAAEQNSIPSYRCREFQSGFELRLGETFVLAGAVNEVHDGEKTEEFESVLLITAELADATAVHTDSQVRTTQGVTEAQVIK